MAVVREKASVNEHPSNTVDGTVHPNQVTDMDEVLAHVPKLMARSVTKFLKRKTNSGHSLVTGKRVNRGAGYGLEVPCLFEFRGDKFSCDWVKANLERRGYEILFQC